MKLLIGIALAAVCAAQGPDADAICARAVEFHRAGEMERAIPEYRKCLELRPGLAELRSNLGAALAHLGRYSEAIEEYREALRQTPGNQALRLNLALAYYKSGDLSDAIPELESLHAGDPEQLNVTLLLADSYLRTGEFRRIIQLLEPVKEQYRDNRAFAYLLGMAFIRDGRVTEGQSIVDAILEDGSSGEAHYLIGTAAFMNRDFPAAVREFQKAIDLDPSMPSVHSWYGQALLETGDADGAANAFRKELAANPNDFESNATLGSILCARHQFDAAVPFLERAVQERASAPGPRLELASAYLNTGKLNEARRELLAVAKAEPGIAEAHARLAEVDRRLGLSAEASRERELAARAKMAAAAGAHGDLLPVGSPAPAFDLPRLGSAARVALPELLRSQPAVIVFGSYTCPQFRSAVGALNAAYTRYSGRARFVLVYVHEAHTDDNWQSTVNAREGIALPPEKTAGEKVQHASLCVRKLDLKFPVLVDGMDRRTETAYAAWPSAVYLVGPHGRIRWRSRLGEQNFAPEELAGAIDQALAAR